VWAVVVEFVRVGADAVDHVELFAVHDLIFANSG
jgi:hypothetical protein